MAKKQKKNETREALIAFAIFLAILAAIIIWIVVSRSGDDAPTAPKKQQLSTEFMEKAPPAPFDIEGFETVAGCMLGELNDSLRLTCVGTYQDSLAAIVENVGDEFVAFAEVKINYGGLDAFFKVTDLPAGSSMLIVESQEIPYAPEMEFKTPLVLGFTAAEADVKTSYAADFDIHTENGILTIENCSGRDFSEPVEIACKKVLHDGVYFGDTIPLATEGVFASGDSRHFNFEAGWQIVCLRYN